MLFSSSIFLFYFLPVFLFFYFISPGIKLKNYVLLLFSFIFFAWGGIFFTLILLLSIVFNFAIGICIDKFRKKIFLGIGITGNLLVLISFKYAAFLVGNLNLLLGFFDTSTLSLPGITLPIGISFYTFHSMSYLVDVYSGKSPAQKNIFNMALYIVLFTQLIAGPIIRYNIFAPQLFGRTFNFQKFCRGAERFIIGLGKKVLIANILARVADDAFIHNSNCNDALFAWLGALCYTFQIYFDFSGYSDMAIGLSKMLGFDFPENFNLPYIATGIKDFWRRWHISLSSFFRDYLYIPLGGNKKGTARTYLNLLFVFFLTGLWHGANYTFIIWGLIHGAFLLLERSSFEKLLLKIPVLFQRLYTFLIVLLAWVPFRADNLHSAVNYWKKMFDFSKLINYNLVSSYITTDFIIAFSLAIILSFNIHSFLAKLLKKVFTSTAFLFPAHITEAVFILAILFLSGAFLMSGSYNPFIYYQF